MIILICGPFLDKVFAGPACSNTGDCMSKSSSAANKSKTKLNEHINQEFAAHRVWWISIFWEDNLLPALMLMAEQLTAVAVKQTEAVGMFMDAKHQMETQQVLQKITARAHKDYQPSTGMCEFGSTVKSLASSERLGEVNAVVMSQRSMDRGLGSANTAAGNPGTDLYSRLKQFRTVYCNRADHNSGLDYMCDHDQDDDPTTRIGPDVLGNGLGGQDPTRLNKDIDYFRTVEMPWTLDVDFTTGGAPTADEEDVLAMATNLYSREVFLRPTGEDLASPPGDPNELTDMQEAYMDARAVLAKRSVAENSYNAIVGMKSAGTAASTSKDFLRSILEELGVADTPNNVRTPRGDISEMEALLGENPSYYAQMEVLTKKIYQNPDFYTNLYDKPANVTRKGVALQAISLMQKFDMLKSFLRNEASQSILLELAIIDLQTEIENNFEEINLGGK